MPSGSKKRKAARKKQEHQPVSDHSNGDDGDKQHDDKDSDVGELNSPTSQDRQSLFSEGEEEENEKGKCVSNTPTEEALKNKDSEEPSTVVEDDAVVPVDREFEIEDKFSKKVDGSSSGSNTSSRSSSDDESSFIQKGETAVDTTPVDLGNGNGSLYEVPADNKVSAEIDDGVDAVVENSPTEELKDTSTLGDRVETDISTTPLIIEPMESEKKSLGFVEDNDVFMDDPLKRKDESIENIVTPDPKECVTEESHDRGVATDAGVEVEKDSGVTEVLLVSAPHPVQTSWKSCCGLFEVFAGSRR